GENPRLILEHPWQKERQSPAGLKTLTLTWYNELTLTIIDVPPAIPEEKELTMARVKTGQAKVVMGTRLPADLVARVREQAALDGIDASDFVEVALRAKLDQVQPAPLTRESRQALVSLRKDIALQSKALAALDQKVRRLMADDHKSPPRA